MARSQIPAPVTMLTPPRNLHDRTAVSNTCEITRSSLHECSHQIQPQSSISLTLPHPPSTSPSSFSSNTASFDRETYIPSPFPRRRHHPDRQYVYLPYQADLQRWAESRFQAMTTSSRASISTPDEESPVPINVSVDESTESSPDAQENAVDEAGSYTGSLGRHILPQVWLPCVPSALTHQLVCGHRVITEQPEPCASNCQVSARRSLVNPRAVDEEFACERCTAEPPSNTPCDYGRPPSRASRKRMSRAIWPDAAEDREKEKEASSTTAVDGVKADINGPVHQRKQSYGPTPRCFHLYEAIRLRHPRLASGPSDAVRYQ